MTINNSDIMKYPLAKSPAVINYSLEFEEHAARVHAGLSLKEYEELPGTMDWRDEEHPISKCEILVLYRLHHQIAAVQHQIANKPRRRG